MINTFVVMLIIWRLGDRVYTCSSNNISGTATGELKNAFAVG